MGCSTRLIFRVFRYIITLKEIQELLLQLGDRNSSYDYVENMVNELDHKADATMEEEIVESDFKIVKKR